MIWYSIECHQNQWVHIAVVYDETYIRRLVKGDYRYLWKVDCGIDNINKLLDTVC